MPNSTGSGISNVWMKIPGKQFEKRKNTEKMLSDLFSVSFALCLVEYCILKIFDVNMPAWVVILSVLAGLVLMVACIPVLFSGKSNVRNIQIRISVPLRKETRRTLIEFHPLALAMVVIFYLSTDFADNAAVPYMLSLSLMVLVFTIAARVYNTLLGKAAR